VYVLNVLAFILVGFQLKGIVARLETRTLFEYMGIAAAVCAATIVSRVLWVSGAAAVGRFRARRRGEGAGADRDGLALTVKMAAVASWCGMRGIVTLAAALGLPTGADGGAAFPHRDLVLFTAFAVVLVTLVVQGLTLRPLMSALRLEDDGSVEREVRFARVETLRAGLAATAAAVGAGQGDALVDLMRRRYEVMLRRAEALLAGGDGGSPVAEGKAEAEGHADAVVARRASAAERARLLALRADGTIGDAAFQRIEQELDLEELDLQLLAPES